MTAEVVKPFADSREKFSSSTPVIRKYRNEGNYFSFDFDANEVPNLSLEANDYVNPLNYDQRFPTQLSPISGIYYKNNSSNPDSNKLGIDLDDTSPSIDLVSELTRKARKCIRRTLSIKKVSVMSQSSGEEGTSSWNFGGISNRLSLPLEGEMQFRIQPKILIQHPDEEVAPYNSMTGVDQIMTRSQIKMLKATGRKSSLTTPTKKSSVSKSSQMKSPRKSKFLGKSNSKIFLDGVFSKVLKKSTNGSLLFGRPLEDVCGSTNEPPTVIMELLSELKRTGPETFGILRKSGSARSVKELKDILDKGTEAVNFDELNVHVVAGLLKDYFRSLPDCLLCSNLYDEWLLIPGIDDEEEKLSFTKAILRKLKITNFNLLKSLMSVLKLIGENSESNKMTYTNLAVCIGPSILWPLNSDCLEYNKEFTSSVSYLIEMSCELFSNEDRLQSPVENKSVDMVTEISSGYVPFCRNISKEAFIRNSVKRKSDKLLEQSSLVSLHHLPVSNHSSVSIESHDSGLNIDIDSDNDFEDLENIEFDFIDGEDEDKENSHPALKRRKQFNYSKKNYQTRYRGFSPSRLRRDDRNQRRSLFRKVPKKSKSLVRAASEESIMQKLAKDEASLDFLDRQLLNETEESNLLYKKKYSITTCSKDSGFTIDDCSASPSEENLLEVVKLAAALKSLECHQPETYYFKTENPPACAKILAPTSLQTETPACCSKAPECNKMYTADCFQSEPSGIRRNSMKKIETFDDVDCKPKGTKAPFLDSIFCNNVVEYTDEQLCPLLTDDEEPRSRIDSSLISQSSFKRNSWMRKRSKKKIKFSKVGSE